MKLLKIFYYIICLLSAFILLSCKSKDNTADAVNYNNKVIYAQNRVTERMLRLSDAINNNKIDILDSIHKELLSETNKSIDEIKSMPAFNGDSSLRDIALELFNFYKSVISNEYIELIKIYKKPDIDFTEDDKNIVNMMIADIEKREFIIDEKFFDVQNKFALKHNFKIIENTLQDSINNILK